MEETQRLTLKGGQDVLLDAKDYARLSQYEYRKSGNDVVRTLARPDKAGKRVRTLKHDIFGRPDVAVQILNGNLFDYRRANLRVYRDPRRSHIARFAKARQDIRPTQHGQASPGKIYSTVPGVTFRKDRANSKPWRVRIQVKGKAYYLGHYATKEEAEHAAQHYYGDE